MPLIQHLTSGHADVDDLAHLVDPFSTAWVVPIHSEGTDRFADHSPDVDAQADHEWRYV